MVGSPKISQVDTEINSYSVVVSSARVSSLSAGTFSTFSLSLKKFLNPYEKKKGGFTFPSCPALFLVYLSPTVVKKTEKRAGQ